MSKRLRLLAVLLVIPMLVVTASNVFAANKYNIDYFPTSGAEELTSTNVVVDENADLATLFNSGNVSFTTSNSSRWEQAYLKTSSTVCRSYSFFRVWANDTVHESDGIYYTITKDNSPYEVRIQINDVVIENIDGLSQDGTTVSVGTYGNHINAGYGSNQIFTDSECLNPYPSDIKHQDLLTDGNIFVETNIKLYKKDTEEVFTSDNLYFGLTDIDVAQSYKILNSDVQLSGNMLAMSADALDTTNPNTGVKTLRNMFVPSENYIYSEYNNSTADIINYGNNNNIFVKVNTDAQREGLKVVFGFAKPAGSGVQYYAKQYVVAYLSDSNGTITGIEDENVVSGQSPSGSETTPNEYYGLKHWTSDSDVTLADNTIIAAGEPLTATQVQQVVVTKNLTFTAIHERAYAVTYQSDPNGTIAGIDSEDVAEGNNPSGSTSTPNEHYVFQYWTADKNVTLEDGTIITAQNPITPEKIKQVVVNQDLTFTAEHDLEQLPVTYETDGHGTITGVISHYVAYGSTPWGSTSAPDEHYTFKHWIADKDVVLEDGTPITAGQPLTPAQVQQVIVTEELTFTAVHESITLPINYESDEHGEITGIASENVVEDGNPTGSESTPAEHYEFVYWIADDDVTLIDGSSIEAGQPIYPDDISQVVVTEPLTFTAIHEKEQIVVIYESDDHGEISSIISEYVYYMDHPTGSKTTPDEGYELDHWVADKDVTMEDGAEIKAGEPISSDQVKQIIVEQDIILTAVYRTAPAPEVPNTGTNTDEDGHATVTTFTGLGAAAAFIAFGIVRLFRRHRANKFN